MVKQRTELPIRQMCCILNRWKNHKIKQAKIFIVDKTYPYHRQGKIILKKKTFSTDTIFGNQQLTIKKFFKDYSNKNDCSKNIPT